jgi:hypothetical protein
MGVLDEDVKVREVFLVKDRFLWGGFRYGGF